MSPHSWGDFYMVSDGSPHAPVGNPPFSHAHKFCPSRQHVIELQPSKTAMCCPCLQNAMLTICKPTHQVQNFKEEASGEYGQRGAQNFDPPRHLASDFFKGFPHEALSSSAENWDSPYLLASSYFKAMQSPSAARNEDVVAPSHDEVIALGHVWSLPEDRANTLYVKAPANAISSGSTDLLGMVSAKALLPEAQVNAPMLLQSALNNEAKEQKALSLKAFTEGPNKATQGQRHTKDESAAPTATYAPFLGDEATIVANFLATLDDGAEINHKPASTDGMARTHGMHTIGVPAQEEEERILAFLGAVDAATHSLAITSHEASPLPDNEELTIINAFLDALEGDTLSLSIAPTYGANTASPLYAHQDILHQAHSTLVAKSTAKTPSIDVNLDDEACTYPEERVTTELPLTMVNSEILSLNFSQHEARNQILNIEVNLDDKPSPISEPPANVTLATAAGALPHEASTIVEADNQALLSEATMGAQDKSLINKDALTQNLATEAFHEVLSYLDGIALFLPNLELLALVLYWFLHVQSTSHIPTIFKAYPHDNADPVKPLRYPLISPSTISSYNAIMFSIRLRGRSGSIQAQENNCCSTTQEAEKKKIFKDRAKTKAELLSFFIMKSPVDPG